MVLNNLTKPNTIAVEKCKTAGTESSALMQYSKLPPQSPDSPTVDEPNGENPEAAKIFVKGGKSQLKSSRNKPSKAMA